MSWAVWSISEGLLYSGSSANSGRLHHGTLKSMKSGSMLYCGASTISRCLGSNMAIAIDWLITQYSGPHLIAYHLKEYSC